MRQAVPREEKRIEAEAKKIREDQEKKEKKREKREEHARQIITGEISLAM